MSAHPEVRAALLELQRRLGAGGGVVVEGRDTGTVVFPHAEAKFFLTATDEERARRRVAELAATGAAVDYDADPREIRERDHRDASRDVAPMVPADDAVLVDSSTQTLEQVVESLARLVESPTPDGPERGADAPSGADRNAADLIAAVDISGSRTVPTRALRRGLLRQ